MKSENLPAVPETYRAVTPTVIDAEYEPQAAHVPLAHYLWILRRHAWKIAGVVLATSAGHTDRVAAADAHLRIHRDHRHRPPACPPACWARRPPQIVNNDADQFLATQVKLIQSDSVLRPVVDKFHLREVEKDALEEADG